MKANSAAGHRGPDTPPLVLVHGFMGGSAQWAGLEQALAPYVDVVSVDLPGFGKNAGMAPINRIEGFADWVMDQLSARGIARYHLLGHSMGGMIVQEMARRDRARIDRLVLYATGALGVLPGRFETIAESKRRAEADGPAATARRIAATWFLQREASPGYAGCAEIAEQTGLDAIHAGLDAMQAWSGEAALADISQDTLILWGDQDRTYTRDQIKILSRDIPKASLAVVPGCAHAVHLENPDLFLRHLMPHLGLARRSEI